MVLQIISYDDRTRKYDDFNNVFSSESSFIKFLAVKSVRPIGPRICLLMSRNSYSFLNNQFYQERLKIVRTKFRNFSLEIHSYFIHISFIFHSYFIHISFIFHSYFIHISFIFHSYFIHISKEYLQTFLMHFERRSCC